MSTLNVKTFGAKGDGIANDTRSIQSTVAAASFGDIVEIPPGRFMIDGSVGADNFASGGVFLKSDMTLQLSAGAALKAMMDSADHGNVLTAKGCKNLAIMGAGSIIGNQDGHPETPKGQFQFGLSIWGGCEKVQIIGPTFAKCWGDGLTIIGAKNVLIDHVVFDGCRRQNVSVIEVDGLSITNCTFKNAQYSALDMEADLDTQSIKNVIVKYCNFVNSVEGPAHIGVGSSAGKYSNISITDCQFDLKMQPIFAHDNAGDTGTPWWAFLYNRIFYEGMHAPWYRFQGYPQSWSSKQ